jgi:hypothetical protein
MIHPIDRLRDLSLSVVLAVAAVFLPASAAAIRIEEIRLPNGLRLLHGESHASGLVASAVLVGAGAARRWEMNGAAHFLEHLLFNGTLSRTQEELYRDTDLLGAYSNATTRRDHVAYLMVLGGEDLERGLEIQADMLFNSTLPAEKFEKERGIILEEIAKDRSNPIHLAEENLDRVLASGTAEELPILGTVESIRALSRDQVLAYYRRYYQPSNMTLLVLGDFEPARLRRRSSASSAGRRRRPRRRQPPPRPAPAAGFGATGVFLRRAALDQVSLSIRLPGPPPERTRSPPSSCSRSSWAATRTCAVRSRLRLRSRCSTPARRYDRAGPHHPRLTAAFDSTASHSEVAARLSGDRRAGARPVPEGSSRRRTRRMVSEALAAEQIITSPSPGRSWCCRPASLLGESAGIRRRRGGGGQRVAAGPHEREEGGARRGAPACPTATKGTIPAGSHGPSRRSPGAGAQEDA